MNFKDILTPKDTEEIKPGLFIQKVRGGYKQIHPAVWKGEYNYKNLLLGHDFLRSFIWFAIIMFLAWSYLQDVGSYQEFYEEVNSNPAEFCANVGKIKLDIYGSTDTLPDNDGEGLQRILPG